MATINETHDPSLRSWVESANAPGSDFPVQNLPFGVFFRGSEHYRIGVAIGDHVLDVAAAEEAGLLHNVGEETAACCHAESLNLLMADTPRNLSELRQALSRLLRADTPDGMRARAVADEILVPMADAVAALPAEIGDYTDFYASAYHATNVGAMLRPENPLTPNYKHVPIGYHGRASTVLLSNKGCIRPQGQTKPPDAAEPVFGPSRQLDFEAELGVFFGGRPARGRAIALAEAERHVFGLCLLNDWSARDIQAWESVPLGPFLSKSFLTTVSPWVVTLEALAPYRVAAFARPEGDPSPLPYLSAPGNDAEGGLDIAMEVTLSSERMREAGMEPAVVTRTNARHLYWTVFQMVAHHSSNGCLLRPGDLFGSGTVSGPTPESRACLLELTRRGREPLTLPTGETRGFLEDGDEVTMRAFCERPGAARIGFGECRDTVVSPPT